MTTRHLKREEEKCARATLVPTKNKELNGMTQKKNRLTVAGKDSRNVDSNSWATLAVTARKQD